MTSLLVLLLLAGDLAGAQKALAAGRPAEALRLLGDLAETDDPSADILVVQGRAYLALREYAAAVEPLMRASDMRPTDKALALAAAQACRGAAQGMYRMLYLADARRLAERAGDAEMLADLAYEAGDLEDALARYRALEDEEETRLHRLTRIAHCLRQLGRSDEASQAYADALDEALRRDDLRAAYRVAFAGGQRGRFLSWLDRKIAEKDDPRLRLYRGYVRSAALMFAEAIEDLRAALKERPQDLEIKDLLSHALLQHGIRTQNADEIEESEKLAREVLAGEPAHQRAWDRLGWIAGHYWVNGRIERSYSVLRDLHGSDPTDINAGLNFGAMARRLGRYEEAAAAYGRLLEVSEEDPDVLNDYAILRDGMGDRAAAAALWERTLKEEPDNLNALENLFTHTWERGQGQAAREYLRRGLDAARRRNGPVDRWLWFEDRLRWAPAGFGE
ncbi:MAG: tetratricopeptide repeat protein [Planctomycetota bacterium]